MSSPSVSVIIPAYRAAATIGRAIDSVLAQSYPACEILVIDDGSPDELQASVAAYAPPVRLICKENGGAASARNLGIEQATGDLLAFLDADDYWEAHKLQEHVSLYQRYPQLGLTHSRYFEQTPSNRRQLIEQLFPVKLGQVQTLSGAQAFAWATAVWTGTVVVPRSVIGEQRFLPGLEPAEDRDLWMRLTTRAPVYCLAAPLATAVLEPASLSRSNVERDCANMLRVVARHRSQIGSLAARKWMSHTHYRWAACSDSTATAVWHFLRSAWLWPLPYGRDWVRMPLARLRLLSRLIRRSASGLYPLRFRPQSDTKPLVSSDVIQ